MSIQNYVVGIIITIIAICYIPGLPPHVHFELLEPNPVVELEGPLTPNDYLDQGERLFENYLLQPESIAVRNPQEIYTGVKGGNIVKIWGKNFENSRVLSYHDNECNSEYEDWKCGRPLAVRFHTDGLLYIIDTYFGLFTLNVDTGEWKNMFDCKEAIEGKRPRLPDDFDFDSEGNIYWSDVSTVADFHNAALEIYSSPSGRLVKFNPKTKEQKVILDKLHFPNGVQFSSKKDFLLVNETPRQRTLRYWLKGPKAGTTEVFARYPGMPDNIRRRPEGGYIVPLIGVVDEQNERFAKFMFGKPTLRKFLCRIYGLVQLLAQSINRVYPNDFCIQLDYDIFSLHKMAEIMENNLSMVVELDEDGKFVRSLHGKTGRISKSSEVQKIGDTYLFGSPFVNYLGRLDMKNINIQSDGKADKKQNKDEL